MSRIAIAMCVASAVAALAPDGLAAQAGCDYCHEHIDYGGPYGEEHHFFGGSPYFTEVFGDENQPDSGHTVLDEGSCHSQHWICEPEEFDREMLFDHHANADWAELVTFVSHRGVSYNSSRSAVQLLNCAGQVVAHLPVPAEFAVEFARTVLSQTLSDKL